MDRFFTVMIVPEREKGVKSFRIPRIVFHAVLFFSLAIITVVGILSYDYLKILRQVYENKHLSIENRQLKEQLQLSHMKLNSLSDEIGRIKTFEKKLRVITGFQKSNLTRHGFGVDSRKDLRPEIILPEDGPAENERAPNSIDSDKFQNDPEDHSQPGHSFDDSIREVIEFKNVKSSEKYIELLGLYEQKIASSFGLGAGYAFTKEWDDLTRQSFSLASDFAEFDAKFEIARGHIRTLEFKIHELDQFLLDRESFLKATPTLLPANGWITSYYGPRLSHYSGRIKMHEGLDIGAPVGTSIVAPADGIVTFSGKKPGFGHFVQVDHGYGLETVYAHNSQNHVRKGQVLKRGDLVGMVGNTGFSTGPHLHYEVRINGTPVDPLYYILD